LFPNYGQFARKCVKLRVDARRLARMRSADMPVTAKALETKPLQLLEQQGFAA
jgi:hypothetical protein